MDKEKAPASTGDNRDDLNTAHPNCDGFKRNPYDILDMFGVDTTNIVLDCNPIAAVRNDNCIEPQAAEEMYGALARAANGQHCTSNEGCRAGNLDSDNMACLTHSKEWFCDDPVNWSGMVPLCEPSDNIETELGPPLLLRKE